jgi:hypothetical protein
MIGRPQCFEHELILGHICKRGSGSDQTSKVPCNAAVPIGTHVLLVISFSLHGNNQSGNTDAGWNGTAGEHNGPKLANFRTATGAEVVLC